MLISQSTITLKEKSKWEFIRMNMAFIKVLLQKLHYTTNNLKASNLKKQNMHLKLSLNSFI